MTRIGILGVFHETNSFSASATGIEGFRRRWYLGDEILGAFTGSRTVIGGVIDEAGEQGLELVPMFATYATPSGPITAAAFDEILRALEGSLIDNLDGVLLELHGDMDVIDVIDPEAVIIAAVRRRLGQVPISAVLDYHANMAAERLSDADVLVGYRLNPHVDTYDRGREALALLARISRDGEPRPFRAHRGVAVVAPPVAQRTDAAPMREIVALADRLRARGNLWAVSVHAGYAYLDASYTGVGFTAYADDPDAALAAVDELAALAAQTGGRFDTILQTPADAVATALQGEGPVVVADTGDNINGGSSGDTTWLAHEALRIHDARFLGTVCDPHALEALEGLAVGDRREITLGGWSGGHAGAPVEGEAMLLGKSDGSFVNEGPMSTGARVEMGAAAWVRIGSVDFVVQQRPTQPNDPQLFRHLGIDPREYDVLLLKGAAAVRAGWAPYATAFVDAATLGETDSMLDRLPYVRFAGSL